MSINVMENTYSVTAVLQDGSTLKLDPAITQLSWQDPADEVAQRALLVLAQVKTDKGWLNSLMPICTAIMITANGAEVFNGIVWEWEYESNNKRVITLTCYDRFIYAQNSKTFAYFPEGKSTKDIVSKVCSDSGISCNYQWQSATHDKITFRGTYVADQIMDTLEDARKRLGQRYVATYAGDTLTIQAEAYNSTVYVFEATKSAMSTSERMTMDGLVTQVAIYGAETKDDRRQLEAIVPGKTEYGTLQDVVLMTSSSKISEAKKDAQGILQEHGEPTRTITAEVPDVPEVRKGWKIKMNAGSLLGYYIVKGVTHNATDRSMTLELRNAS